MNETDWLTPSLVLLVGAVTGVLLALRDSGNGERSSAQNASLQEDLLREKERLLRAIRELQDTPGGQGASENARELSRLEQQAATVLRQLEEGLEPLAAAQLKEQGQSSESESPSGPRPRRRFAIQAVVVVGFLVLLSVALTRGTAERTGDMQITGMAPEVSEIAKQAPVPTEGQAGGAVPGVPAALKPKPSARVDRARARVSVETQSPEAWAELGYALLDAEGWIDAFQTAQTLRQMAPESPDARVIEAMVRIPMGQPEVARALLNEAITMSPQHVMALTARGMVQYSSGNSEAAKSDWTTARSIAGPGQGHDALLAMLEGGATGSPSAGRSQLPPGHPPTTEAKANEGVPQDARTVSGTVQLAQGVTPPSDGVVFIYARHPGQKSGPPVAVKRLMKPRLPLAFELGPADQMIQGMPFPQKLDLSARWDIDGNAMTKGAEDLHASIPGIDAGSSGLELVLTSP